MIGAAERRHWLLSAFGLALLVVCARWFLGSFGEFSGAQDLQFFDDSQYLAVGVFAPDLHHLHAQWAPPYCIWYRLLFHVANDTIVTYHLNAYVLAFAFPLLWFVVCVALRVSPLWALVSALAWLISTANLDTLHVGVFAACIVFSAIIVGKIFPRPALAWWIVAAGVTKAAFVRPEFLPAVAACIAFGAWQLARGGLRRSMTGAWIAAALLPFVVLSAWFGVPVGGGRSGAAFQQHLAGNILQWHHLPFENWIHFEDVIRTYYALPTGIADFAVHEPLAFLHHVATNGWRLFTQSAGAALRPSQALMDSTGGWPLALVLLTIVAAGVARFRGEKHSVVVLSPAVVALAACALLIVASCLAIYPREHYLPLLLAALLLLIAPRSGENPRTLLHAVGMLLVAATIVLMPGYGAARTGLVRPTEDTVRVLRTLDASQPLKLFDDSGVLHIYLQRPAQRVGPREFKPPFSQFLADSGVNVVVRSPLLGRDPVLAPDPSWQLFEKDPHAFGFRCAPVTNTDRVVCVRKDLQWSG